MVTKKRVKKAPLGPISSCVEVVFNSVQCLERTLGKKEKEIKKLKEEVARLKHELETKNNVAATATNGLEEPHGFEFRALDMKFANMRRNFVAESAQKEKADAEPPQVRNRGEPALRATIKNLKQELETVTELKEYADAELHQVRNKHVPALSATISKLKQELETVTTLKKTADANLTVLQNQDIPVLKSTVVQLENSQKVLQQNIAEERMNNEQLEQRIQGFEAEQRRQHSDILFKKHDLNMEAKRRWEERLERRKTMTAQAFGPFEPHDILATPNAKEPIAPRLVRILLGHIDNGAQWEVVQAAFNTARRSPKDRESPDKRTIIQAEAVYQAFFGYYTLKDLENHLVNAGICVCSNQTSRQLLWS